MASLSSLPMEIFHPDNNVGRSLHHIGALVGHWNLLTFLHDSKLHEHVNHLDILGETPLSYALRGNTAIDRLDTYMCVYTLLKMGADVNCVGANRLSPLMLAVLMNDVHLVDILLQHNADINYRYITEESLILPNNSTALSIACSVTKNPAIVTALLNRRSNMKPHILFHALQRASEDMKAILRSSP